MSRRCLICANLNPCRDHSGQAQESELERNCREITRLNAEVERARADALEEAAAVAFAFRGALVNPAHWFIASDIATNIRALILKARGKDANVG